MSLFSFKDSLRNLDLSLFRLRLIVASETGLDCTVLLQEMGNKYGWLELPKGTFKVSQTLFFPMFGQGREKTIVTWADV